MSDVAFVSHADCGRHDTGWGHPEHVGRLRMITRALRNRPELFMDIEHVTPRHASEAELALAHDAAYVRSVRDIAAAGGGRLDADTVTSEGSWDAGTAGAGAVIHAVDMAMDGRARRSFCAVRPPGHHALYAAAMGFCLFGNAAVGAHYARQRHGLERVLVIDWDVHHGNGTQALVERDPAIRFVDLHQWPWYPGTGAVEDRGPHGSIWNVAMPAALPPARYVDALLGAIDDATRGWLPEFVIVSAGFDCLRGDPLGGFTLELDDLDLLTRALVERAQAWCSGRLVSVLEGGYAPDRVAEASVVHLAALR